MESTTAPPRQRRRRILPTLPYDVVADIVGRVTATSPHPLAELVNIGARCKAMYAATKETVVLRRASLEKERAVKWCKNSHFLVLLTNMASAGNSEACFLSGFLIIFMHGHIQSGIALLEQAAATGHKTSVYVLGVVLYRTDNTRDTAKRYINQVEADSDVNTGGKRMVTNRNCSECRWRAVLLMPWMKIPGAPNRVLPRLHDNWCARNGSGLRTLWSKTRDVFCTKDCRITYEYTVFRAFVLALLG